MCSEQSACVVGPLSRSAEPLSVFCILHFNSLYEREGSIGVDTSAFAVDTTFGLPVILQLLTSPAGLATPLSIDDSLWRAITEGDRGSIALLNSPFGSPGTRLPSSASVSGFDLLFVRNVNRALGFPTDGDTYVDWVNSKSPAHAMFESNLMLLQHDWTAEHHCGTPTACGSCHAGPGRVHRDRDRDNLSLRSSSSTPSSPSEWRRALMNSSDGRYITISHGPIIVSQQNGTPCLDARAPAENSGPTPQPDVFPESGKAFLCLYVFGGTRHASQDNFMFFLSFGIDANSPHINYIIVIPDIDPRPLPLSAQLQRRINEVNALPNVHVYHRQNVGLDFCSYAEALSMLGGIDALRKLYKYVLFINDTVRGPFIPSYLRSEARQPRSRSGHSTSQRPASPSLQWYALYTSKLGTHSRFGTVELLTS
jgi:hypothetical protein